MAEMQYITTDHLPEGARARFWRGTVCETLAELDVSGIADAGFQARLEMARAGEGLICGIDSSKQYVARTKHHLRRGGETYFKLAMQVGGTAHVEQRGRSFELQAGDFALLDSTEPYALGFAGPFKQIVLQIPQAWLRDQLRIRGFVGGLRLGRESPVARLAFRHVADLFSELPAIDAALLGPLTRQGTDMVATAVNLLLEQEFGKGSPSRKALAARVFRHFEESLHDCHHDLDTAARSLGISKRTLHEVFAEMETTPQRWMLEQRLIRCCRDLRNPAHARVSIIEIAFRWGFNSHAHFTRSYRAFFGRTPREERGVV